MTGNRKNWLYPEASGLYFPHDGFVMRALDGKQYDIDEECELLNAYHKENNELKKSNDYLQNQLEDYVTVEADNIEIREENERLKFENETLKSNYQREIQSSIDFCNAYSKTNGELLEEIYQLKQKIEQLKQQCKHFMEMLDDMSIAYLCDEWIYEELEGDLNDRE